jgi:triosephosphate isomerase
MRKKIVAGNWKMNLSLAEGKQLISDVVARLPLLTENQEVIFCPPYTHLSAMASVLDESADKSVNLGSQNVHPQPSGAFTGEVSIPMLKEVGVKYVIIGHSERRQYFGETNEFLKSKVDALVAEGMNIIFCCGEPLQVREANGQNEYVATQLKESLFHLSAEQLAKHVVIAYEPIWAIGTGVTASTDQAQEMHASIRQLVREQFGAETADNLSILYGGSCNPANAVELFSCPDVDGGLIGGAALKAETFIPIIFALV